MDFSWAINALKEGKKVTRRSLAGDPPIYLYWNKADNTIMRDYGARTASKWHPSLDNLFAEDWEEYVEPKTAPAKATHEELPVWPEVDADGYAHMSKDSDVIIHDGVYRCKKEPAAGYISLSPEKETRLPNNPSYDDTQDSHGGKPVEELDIDAETNKAIALVARNIAENLVELLRNPSVQRILHV